MTTKTRKDRKTKKSSEEVIAAVTAAAHVESPVTETVGEMALRITGSELATETETAAEAPPAPEDWAEASGPTDETIIEAEKIAPEAVEDVSDTVLEAALKEAPAFVINPDAPVQSFVDQLKAISDEDALIMANRSVAAIDERRSFEMIKDPGNTNILKALDKSRKQLATLTAARVLIATNVDPMIFNREIHTGSRYNVYALGKLADVIAGVSADKYAISNAINNACMRSLFRFRAAKVAFTGEMAKAAASDKIRHERAITEMLVRHTVSASTAPTQASSTMQAFETLGIVKRSGSQKNPTFDLTDSPIVQKIEASLAA